MFIEEEPRHTFSPFGREAKIARMFANGAIFGESDDGDGGGGGGEGDDKSFSQSDVDKAVKAALEKETAGLKEKNSQLLETISKNKDVLKKIDGIDVDNLLKLKDTVENDEILKMVSEGKHQEAIDKALEKTTVKFNADLKKRDDEIGTLAERNKSLTNQLHTLLIDDKIKDAFSAASGIEEAKTDVVLRAKMVFAVDDDGQVVARDSEGKLIQGKDGNLTPSEWIESLKETAPHFFPESSGGLARRGGKGGSDDSGNSSDNESGISDKEYEEAAKQGPAALRKLKERRQKAKFGNR